MDRLLVIVGCTASGKSELAEAIALRQRERFGQNPTIMAVDSMQVYRGMDIGTAKPSAQARQRINYLMLDVADPWESFSAARFAGLAGPLIEQYRQNREAPGLILVAGTVLYLRALLEGLFEGPAADPVLRTELRRRAAAEGAAALHHELAAVDPAAGQRIHPNDLRRIIRALEVFRLTGTPISQLQTQWTAAAPRWPCRLAGLVREKADLNHRINRRVHVMIEAGLVDEVRRLAAGSRPLSMQARAGVGYKEVLEYLAGQSTLAEAIERIKINTRHLAKLQRTWLRRFTAVQWFPLGENQSAADLADRVDQLRRA
jgi:tRNA dimethylallyltransferase